jgi:type IV secretory pathway TraG/TraD family ATPase VirD4
MLVANSGLLAGYLSCCCGLAAGLLAARAPWRRLLAAPLLAAPVALGGAIIWSAVLSLFPGIARLLGPQFTPLAGAAALFAVGTACALVAPRGRSPSRFQRGARVLDSPSRSSVAHAAGAGAVLMFAGQRVPPGDESKHFKLLGTTGTGKSTAIRGLLAGALARGDRAVIADPDGGYAERFYTADRGDLILNPFDPRSARWDLYAELREPQDADLLARALITDHPGDDRAWRGYARVFVAATLRQLLRVGVTDLATLHRILVTAPVEELRALLADTSAAPYLESDNARFFASVRAVAATHLGVLEHLERPRGGRPLSVREWVRRPADGLGGALFLPYRAGQIATLRNVISAWMRLAISETMELGERDHRLWFVVDELDALGAIDGLKDALARLRKFGGRTVLGLQSIAQVSGSYGSADAQTIVENCGNTLVLRCSASENGGTARFASKLIGDREILRDQVTRSRNALFDKPHRSVTTSQQHILEAAVLPAEIEQLPDLVGYLKFASTPQWTRTAIPLDPPNLPPARR